MSSSIAIPKRKSRFDTGYGGSSVASSSSSATSPSSYSDPNTNSPASSSSVSRIGSTMASPPPQGTVSRYAERRPSLLGTSISKSEYTVINVAGPDGPPRLITCVKASQGFDWNQDIFLPSYMDYDSSDLERKPDPVQDIILTDEEAAALLPQ
ncbi:hypothetical protein MBLNU457_2305t1 [Dothideomycetes sp. NU457]